MSGFSRIIVVGVGLIGGSLAAAVRALAEAPPVLGVDTDEEALAWAVEHGVLDEGLSPEAAEAAGWLAGGPADLVVLATPAAAAEEWLRRLGEVGYRGTVTDVASTKTGVTAAARAWLAPGAAFVGGHPMAGSERSGVRNATHALFRGAYYVLTPDQSTDMEAYRRLHALVGALGARAMSVDPDRHDEAVAVVSHVPHVAASALTNLAAERGGEALRLAAGGFKDMTRVAAGSPDLWTGICLDNREAIGVALRGLGRELDAFSSALRHGDVARVRAWLARAADTRSSLPAEWVPATERLTEVTIPVIDRPGVISEVTMAVGRAGCNIEDIEILHQTESSAMLRLVLTDEGDLPALLDALLSLGYEPEAGPLSTEEA